MKHGNSTPRGRKRKSALPPAVALAAACSAAQHTHGCRVGLSLPPPCLRPSVREQQLNDRRLASAAKSQSAQLHGCQVLPGVSWHEAGALQGKGVKHTHTHTHPHMHQPPTQWGVRGAGFQLQGLLRCAKPGDNDTPGADHVFPSTFMRFVVYRSV